MNETVELPTQWRVYRKEWVQSGKFETEEQASAGVEIYRERLEEDDVKLEPSTVGDRLVLWMRMWNVTAEFKHRQQAEAFVAASTDTTEVRVVERNSRAEHSLRDYGKLKLRRS